jgi:formate-dependent nitrite reductase membrane component NrfD
MCLRAALDRATMAAALMTAEGRCNMSLRTRKILVAGVVVAILVMANFLVLAHWLDRVGVIGCAQALRHEYLTGTAITIIVVLLVLIVPQSRVFILGRGEQSRCRVCDGVLDRTGRYCPTCGSRI